MVTGAALATINRLPVLLLPSDYYATRRQGPVLQQLEHPVSFDESVNDCFRPVSRFFDRISRPEQLTESLLEAMRVLTDPAETGAVTIALPQDVQSEAAIVAGAALRAARLGDRATPADAAAASATPWRMLATPSQRPFIIAGGGVHYSEAWDDSPSSPRRSASRWARPRRAREPSANRAICSSAASASTGSPAAGHGWPATPTS